MGLSIKIIMFPVYRSGEYIRAEWELFFLFFSIFLKYFFQTLFSPGKNKYFAAARLATILATRWTGNRLFSMDGPDTCLIRLR